jgi:hypothetical protein
VDESRDTLGVGMAKISGESTLSLSWHLLLLPVEGAAKNFFFLKGHATSGATFRRRRRTGISYHSLFTGEYPLPAGGHHPHQCLHSPVLLRRPAHLVHHTSQFLQCLWEARVRSFEPTSVPFIHLVKGCSPIAPDIIDFAEYILVLAMLTRD